MSNIMWVFVGVMVVISGILFLIRMFKAINQKAFVMQIQKLIFSNNIDRAIKLCSVAPKSPFALAVKELLGCHRAPYWLEIKFQEGWRNTQNMRKLFSWYPLVLFLILMGFFFVYFSLIVAGTDLSNLQFSVPIFFFLVLFTGAQYNIFVDDIHNSKRLLFNVKTLLVNRARQPNSIDGKLRDYRFPSSEFTKISQEESAKMWEKLNQSEEFSNSDLEDVDMAEENPKKGKSRHSEKSFVVKKGL